MVDVLAVYRVSSSASSSSTYTRRPRDDAQGSAGTRTGRQATGVLGGRAVVLVQADGNDRGVL
jgi:hypothetical protein